MMNEKKHMRFRWLDATANEILERQFFSPPMPRGRGKLTYKTMPAHLKSDTVDGKRHVIFNGYYLQPSTCKKALALKSSGNYYLTFIGCCIREDQKPELFFDQYYEVDDYHELFALISGSSTYAVVSLIQPLVNGAIAVEALKRNGVKAIIDVNDSLYYMRKNPDMPECRLEREILEHAHCLIHKMPGWAVDEIRDAWHVSTPDILVHSLPVKSLFNTCRPLDSGHVPKLVFAGGIVPYNIARERGHGNHIMDPVITSLCTRGIDLTFYVNQNARDISWEDHEHYWAFQETYPNFHFKKGVPFFDLPNRLSDHHFAIYYENVQRSDYHDKHFSINMATKFFSYIEAGLPIIIHTGAHYMLDLVERYGIGLVYDIENLDAIPDLIQSCDHQTLQKNIDVYRQDNENGLNAAILEDALSENNQMNPGGVCAEESETSV